MGNIPHMGVDPDGGWCCGGQVVGSGPILAGVLLDEVVITASRISAATVAAGAMSGLATVSENTNMGGFNINGGGQSTVSYEGFDKPYTQGDGSFVPSEVPDYGIPERVKPQGLGGPSEPSVFSDMMKYVTLDNAQMAIDAAGWIPGVQTVSGIVSAGISVYKGNYGSALLSLASAVPVVGYVAKGGKVLRSVVKLQRHHIIPNQIYKRYKSTLDAVGWYQNHGLNLKKLPIPFHGNHPAYNNYVRRKIEQMTEVNLHNMKTLQDELRQEINSIYLSKKYERLNHYYKK